MGMFAMLKIREFTFQELHTPFTSWKLDIVLMDGRWLSCEGLMAKILHESIKSDDPVLTEREACAAIADAERVELDQDGGFDPWYLGGGLAAEQIAEKIRARSGIIG